MVDKFASAQILAHPAGSASPNLPFERVAVFGAFPLRLASPTQPSTFALSVLELGIPPDPHLPKAVKNTSQ